MTLDPLVRKVRLGRRPRLPPRRHRGLHPEAAALARRRVPGHARGGGRGRPAAARRRRLGATASRSARPRCEAVLKEIGADERPAAPGPEQGRPVAPEGAATRSSGGRAGARARVGADRRGPPRPRSTPSPRGSTSLPRRVRLRFRAADAPGDRGVYAAGRVARRTRRGRRVVSSTPSCRRAPSSATGGTCGEAALAALARRGSCPRRRRVRAARRRPRVPEGEDYVFPAPAAGRAGGRGAKAAARRPGRDVLAGDAASAERRLARLRRPGARGPSVDTALAYARLRGRRVPTRPAAASRPCSARAPAYVPALVGAGSAAVRRGDDGRALELYRRAQALGPGRRARPQARSAAVKLRSPRGAWRGPRRRCDGGRLRRGGTRSTAPRSRRPPRWRGLRLALADLLAAAAARRGPRADVLAADPTGDRQVRLRLGRGARRAAATSARAETSTADLLAATPATRTRASGPRRRPRGPRGCRRCPRSTGGSPPRDG